MKVQELIDLQSSGQFHHATYRDIGKLWEGLCIYKKDSEGCRGFSYVGSFGKGSPELLEAETLCRGISVGSYGNG